MRFYNKSIIYIRRNNSQIIKFDYFERVSSKWNWTLEKGAPAWPGSFSRRYSRRVRSISPTILSDVYWPNNLSTPGLSLNSKSDLLSNSLIVSSFKFNIFVVDYLIERAFPNSLDPDRCFSRRDLRSIVTPRPRNRLV